MRFLRDVAPSSLIRYLFLVPISRAEVHHTAGLARLTLTDEEEVALTRDLDQILDAFTRLRQLDTSGVEPTACVDDFGGILREDAVVNPPADDSLLANAPARTGRFFRVPKILD